MNQKENGILYFCLMKKDASSCLRKIFYAYGFKALDPAENLTLKMHAYGSQKHAYVEDFILFLNNNLITTLTITALKWSSKFEENIMNPQNLQNPKNTFVNPKDVSKPSITNPFISIPDFTL